MKLTKEMMNAIINGISPYVQPLNKVDADTYHRIRDNIEKIETEISPLENFIKMFQKKKMDYLGERQINSEVGTAIIINNFQNWLMQQTTKYKALEAERKLLISKADDINNQMNAFVEGRWE